MATVGLTGQQTQELVDTILSAYSRPALKKTLFFRLDRHLDQIVAPAPAGDQVFELVGLAEEEGWTTELHQLSRRTACDEANRGIH